MQAKSIINTDEIVMDSVLCTLQYYSLFRYPLKAEEVYGSSPTPCSLSALLVALEDLDAMGKIYKYDGYYSLSTDVKEHVVRRRAANALANREKNKAIKVGKFISKFPFVRFIGISGSLSKGYADSKSDFDFFIVTDENRLWICRTILHLFKKITFLAGQQHKFCMNYFIDTYSLEIEEKNSFTAIELSSLIPVCGYDTYTELESANKWVSFFLPNGYARFGGANNFANESNGPVKRLFEFIFNRLSPEKLNERLMRLTDNKWREKWSKKNFPMQEYNLAFKTTLHISKNHHKNHQKRVLDAISKFDECLK